MILRDIYNIVGDAAQDTFFSEDFSAYEVINANTEAHYRYTGHNDDICLGGYRSEILSKDWVLGLTVTQKCGILIVSNERRTNNGTS